VPLDASRNSLVVPLLGLLVEQPAHAYDLTVRLGARYPHLPVTRSTVTTLLKSIERAGLIAALAPERVDGRPPRTAYELTGAGFADFSSRIEAGLREAQPASTDFVMAVSYAGVLPAGTAAAILDARADRLGADVVFRHERPDDIPEAHMLEVDYWRAVVRTEIEWLSGLAARIRSRDIPWPTPPAPGPERTRS
jgi:DNA-binding PadR family transcriptional regulator